VQTDDEASLRSDGEQRDTGGEDGESRRHHERRHQSQRQQRRPAPHVLSRAGVEAHEAPSRTAELQQHRRDQEHPEQHVPPDELTDREDGHPERCEQDDQHDCRRGSQPLVPVHSAAGLEWGTGSAPRLLRRGHPIHGIAAE
jgi:hypothetical protein